MLINGVPHIRPTTVIGSNSDACFALTGGVDAEMIANWRNDFGYETLEPIILDESQMGDGADTWIGLNSISNL